MGFALKFGALYFRVPETIRVTAEGSFRQRVGPKDLILSITADIGADGATYEAIEFTGDAMQSMDMSGRMTCCNMAIEMGAKAGICSPGFHYLGLYPEITEYSTILSGKRPRCIIHRETDL